MRTQQGFRRRTDLAPRAGHNQQRCRQQDCRRQRNRHKSDRCFHHVSRRDANRRALAFSEMVQIKICRDYAGSGIAMVTLIESTVSATTRHSDNAPIASEAAMALVNREEATGTERVSKPAVPGDRIIGQILACAGESPTDF